MGLTNMKTQSIYSIITDNGQHTKQYEESEVLAYHREAKRLLDNGEVFDTLTEQENLTSYPIDNRNTYQVDSVSTLDMVGITNGIAYNLRVVNDDADAVSTTIEIIVVNNKIVSEQWRIITQSTDTNDLKAPFSYTAKGKFKTALYELLDIMQDEPQPIMQEEGIPLSEHDDLIRVFTKHISNIFPDRKITILDWEYVDKANTYKVEYSTGFATDYITITLGEN